MTTEWASTQINIIGASINITLTGDQSRQDAISQLEGINERSLDMRPVMRKRIYPYFMESGKKIFRSEGLPEKWPKLAQATIDNRERQGFGSGPILVNTGDYRNSLTKPGARGQVLEIRRNGMTFGSKIPYHKYHMKKTPKMPKRAAVVLQRHDAGNIGEMIGDWVFEGKL